MTDFPPTGPPRRASYETQRLQEQARDQLQTPQPERVPLLRRLLTKLKR